MCILIKVCTCTVCLFSCLSLYFMTAILEDYRCMRNDLNQFRYILQFLLIKCCEPYCIQNHQLLRLLHWGLVYDFDSDTVFKFYYNFKLSHQVFLYSVAYQISLCIFGHQLFKSACICCYLSEYSIISLIFLCVVSFCFT